MPASTWLEYDKIKQTALKTQTSFWKENREWLAITVLKTLLHCNMFYDCFKLYLLTFMC